RRSPSETARWQARAPANTAAPRSVRRVFMLESTRAALISLLSFSTISVGVALGTTIPYQPLASRKKFAHGRDVRQRLLTLFGGPCQRTQLAGPDVSKRRRHDAEQDLYCPPIRSGSAIASPR